MSKFKVGDKVKVLYAGMDTHLIGKICEVTRANDYGVWVQGSRGSWSANTKGLELVEEECEPCVGSKVVTGVDDTEDFEITAEDCDTSSMVCGSTLINKKETFMSKATNYIKNLTLSADEKLLRKYGFKDGCGDYTGEAIDLVKMKLVKDNEAYLIEIAKGLEAEEEKNK